MIGSLNQKSGCSGIRILMGMLGWIVPGVSAVCAMSAAASVGLYQPLVKALCALRLAARSIFKVALLPPALIALRPVHLMRPDATAIYDHIAMVGRQLAGERIELGAFGIRPPPPREHMQPCGHIHFQSPEHIAL